jgi:SNF2 family DNA or RNA helicase
MEEAQALVYRRLKKDMWVEVDGKEVLAPNKLALMMRLQQIALSTELVLPGTSVNPTATLSAKLWWLVEWLSNEDRPVVIASRFRKFVELLETALPQAGISERIAIIVGGMSERAVAEELELFNSSDCRILMGTLSDALSEGHNLQKAATIIIMDGSYDPVVEYQMSKRVHRIGQERPCEVYHLVSTYVVRGQRYNTVDQLCRLSVRDKLSQAEMLSQFVKQLQEE